MIFVTAYLVGIIIILGVWSVAAYKKNSGQDGNTDD